MKKSLVLLLLTAAMTAAADSALTIERWNSSDDALYFHLRRQEAPLPIQSMEGRDQLTVLVYCHGFLMGWESGIRGISSKLKPTPPATLQGDTQKADLWNDAFYDGEGKGNLARKQLKEKKSVQPRG